MGRIYETTTTTTWQLCIIYDHGSLRRFPRPAYHKHLVSIAVHDIIIIFFIQMMVWQKMKWWKIDRWILTNWVSKKKKDNFKQRNYFPRGYNIVQYLHPEKTQFEYSLVHFLLTFYFHFIVSSNTFDARVYSCILIVFQRQNVPEFFLFFQNRRETTINFTI